MVGQSKRVDQHRRPLADQDAGLLGSRDKGSPRLVYAPKARQSVMGDP